MRKPKWVLSRPAYRDIHGTGFVEVICEHGVGHHKGVHRCHNGEDGKFCCESCPPELWEHVSKD